MYQYRGFGLCITSEIEFPELLPADFPQADITITWGKAPERLEHGKIVHRAFSSISEHEFLLSIKNICTYYVSYGSKIIVEPDPGIDERSIRLFLLGTVMAALLYQRGSIPLHASAIVKEEKLLLFAGNSGAGKSTLLAYLASQGYTIFTDDICVLHRNDKGIFGTASYPMIKLWDDAIAQLDNDLFTRDFKVRPQLPKYGQFFYESFNLESHAIGKIFILSPQNSVNDISIKKILTIQAFKQLERQAYKYQLISNTILRSLLFSLLSQLVSQVPVFEVVRPLIGSKPELLLEAMENLF